MQDLTEADGNRKLLGERLRTAISASDLTIDAFASGVGASLSGVRKWLSGAAEPAFSSIAIAAKITKVRLDWLATGEGPMRPGETEEGQTPPSTKKEHHPEETISKKIAFNVMIALAPHFGITKEPAQDELAKLFLDLCDYVRENSNGTSAEIIDFGMRRVNRSQAS